MLDNQLKNSDAQEKNVEFQMYLEQTIYSDDSFIRIHLFPVNISWLRSFPGYWIAH